MVEAVWKFATWCDGMHPGVRSPRPAHWRGNPGQLVESAFQACLDGGSIRLTLPAVKVGSIIGQN